MQPDHREPNMVTKVPVELLFTDLITEEHKMDIPHYTDLWYDHHKIHANLPLMRLSPHLQLYRYFLHQEGYPDLYVDWYRSIHTTRNLEIPLSDAQLMEWRLEQYRIIKTAFAQNPDYFHQEPVVVQYNKSGSYFNLKDGHHRAMFQYCSGARWIPAEMTKSDYEVWKNNEQVGQVSEVFLRHHRTLIYTPILNPYYMDLKSERDHSYPTRLDLILEYMGSTPLAGKKIIDIGCNIGYYARHFTREGAIVTGVEPMAEHYELARQLNLLERVSFDLRAERFETSGSTERYDIGLLLTVFYHLMQDPQVREAFIRKLNESVDGLLFWESGDQPELEKAILLNHTHFDVYEKLGNTEGTGKKRELGVFRRSSYTGSE